MVFVRVHESPLGKLRDREMVESHCGSWVFWKADSETQTGVQRVIWVGGGKSPFERQKGEKAELGRDRLGSQCKFDRTSDKPLGNSRANMAF